MKNKFFLLFFCISILVTFSSYAQNNRVVSVNTLTGTANVGIPMYSLNNGNASLSVSLSYNAGGLRPTDAEGSAGMGWNLNAGGAIRRQVNGLPDDVVQDMLGNEIFGWMYNDNVPQIGPHVFTNDNNTSTFADVAADMSFINTKFGDFSDTEPDIFNIDAPGLSCKLIYDKVNSTFRTIPFVDLKISYTVNVTAGPTRGAITSFTIVNDDGVSYKFSMPEIAMQKVGTVTATTYFQTAYHQYLNGISYYSTWDLTSITDPYGNAISMNYVSGTKKGFTNSKSVILATPSNSAQVTPLYVLYGNNTPNLLQKISYVDAGGSKSVIDFTWITNRFTVKDVISTVTGQGRLFQFTYDDIRYANATFSRKFLNNVTDQDCSSPFKYSFNYRGGLPDSTHIANLTDLWGYYNEDQLIGNSVSFPGIIINPSTASYDRYRNHGTEAIPAAYSYTMDGANMSSNSSSTYGSLYNINYANGGSTTLAYEPNDYYDNLINANVNGGGIRIKSITDYDGINSSNNMVRNFTYVDASGHSYGKPTSLPIYAFTRPYTGTGTAQDLWRYSTVRSTGDLSGEDHSILYSTVKEVQAGKGSTEYNYLNTAMAFDGNVITPIAWSPLVTSVGATTTAATGFYSNDKNTYPFAPNTNYDFERGLLSKVINYNESGIEVGETNYTYTTPQAPLQIVGLKYDANAFGVAYAKYNFYTATGPLVSQVTSKVFDSGSTTLSHSVVENRVYNPQFKLKQSSTINSDGSTYMTNTLYAKDYDTSNKIDDFTQAIYNLQQSNMNLPVEIYSQIKPIGSSQFLTTHATVAKFGSNWPAYTSSTLPVQKLAINSPNGISGFVPSSTATGNFVADPNYMVSENDIAYDFSGALITKSDNYKNIQSAFTDHESLKTVATFSNANWNEVAYTDYSSRGNFNSFAGPGTTVSYPSRSNDFCAALTAGSVQSVTLSRNLLAKSYICSMWIKSSSAGIISVTASGTGGTNTKTINFDDITDQPGVYPTGWQYYEVAIPLTGITSSIFTISFSSNQNITVDDILAYPENAEVKTFGYDPGNGYKKRVETNTSGKSSYYSYDQFDRLHSIFDQDKNIIQRNRYVNGTNAVNFTNPVFSAPTVGYANVPIAFDNTSGYNTCVKEGMTFKWNFGDGTPEQITTSYSNLMHTFQSTGSFTTTLTAVSALYGTKSISQSISIAPLAQVNITYTNPTTGSPHTGIASIVFMQGAVVKYTFSESSLISGVNIAPGTYTIKIHPTGSNYNSVSYDGPTPQCFAKTGSDFVFTDNLTTASSINFKISNIVCAF